MFSFGDRHGIIRGHNLPESGVDRYCIDLICIAGSPLTTLTEEELKQQFPSLLSSDETVEGASDTDVVASNTGTSDTVLTSENFDPNTYESSAVLNSGNVSNKKRNIIIGVVVAIVIVFVLGLIVFYKTKNNIKQTTAAASKDDEKTNDDENASSSLNSN